MMFYSQGAGAPTASAVTGDRDGRRNRAQPAP